MLLFLSISNYNIDSATCQGVLENDFFLAVLVNTLTSAGPGLRECLNKLRPKFVNTLTTPVIPLNHSQPNVKKKAISPFSLFLI